MKTLKTFIALLFILSAPPLSRACDFCAIYSSREASGENFKGFQLGLSEQFTHFGTLQKEGDRIDNLLEQSMDSSITQLLAGYGFNGKIGVQLNLPIISRHFKRAHGAGFEKGSESGIGDLSLVGKFIPYQKQKENFTFSGYLLGGIKFPTGSSDRLAEELEEDHHHHDHPESGGEVEEHEHIMSGIHGHDLALGSGSVDGILGAHLSMRSYRFLVTGSLQYFIRSRGSYQYRYANDLQWNISPGGYVLMNHNLTLALQARLSGETKGLDNLAGVPAQDTGLTTVYLGPEASLTWRNQLSADLGVDLPLVLKNTNLQIVPDYRFRAGVTWQF